MSIVKAAIKKLISSAGYSLHKNSFIPENTDNMDAGLKRLKCFQIDPDIIIDIGAAQGTWTRKALEIWPSAKYELIEPLEEQVIPLDKLKKQYSKVDFHLAVAGEKAGDVDFSVSPDLDGSGIYSGQTDNIRKVPVITLDSLVRDRKGAILVKFDTHGYEVPILKGSLESLEKIIGFVIEVYGFRISPTCLLFHELTAYLDEIGFRLIDLVDIMRRPGDNAFWQADAFYLKKNNPAFDRNTYA